MVLLDYTFSRKLIKLHFLTRHRRIPCYWLNYKVLIVLNIHPEKLACE